MNVGISGSHRVGKSTLAKAYSEACGIPYLQTNVVGTFERLGLDPKADYPFNVRLFIQAEILKDLRAIYESAKSFGVFITDRTPLCLLMYTMAEVRRDNVGDDLTKELAQYVDDCYRTINEFFSAIVLLQPGIGIVDDPTKGVVNFAYMEHLNSLIFGLCADERMQTQYTYIPRGVLDLTRRVNAVRQSVDMSLHHFERRAKRQNKVVLTSMTRH